MNTTHAKLGGDDLRTALRLLEEDFLLSAAELAEASITSLEDPAKRAVRARSIEKKLGRGKALTSRDLTFFDDLVAGEMESLGFKLIHEPATWRETAAKAADVASLAEALASTGMGTKR